MATKIATKNTRTQTSVENGIKILKTAIKDMVSLSEASRIHNFGRNYLSDIKARLGENYKRKNVNKDTYKSFVELLKTYNKL